MPIKNGVIKSTKYKKTWGEYFMSIEDTVYSLKEKYQKHSYGIKVKGYISDNPDDWIIQSDLILQRKDGKPINIDDYVILSNKDYNNRLEAARLNAKLELLNEIFEDNPDKCCITGCHIDIGKDNVRK